MQPVDGGGGSSWDAGRAAEEAARRAAEEARRQAVEEARRAAERQRLIEINRMDAYESTPAPSTFSPAATPVAPATATSRPGVASATYTPEEAARLAATPVAPDGLAPNSLVSPTDQSALAQLAFRMEEHGATPEQVAHAVAETRLSQIERDQQALASVDGAALEQQGRTLETSAQASLDHYIRNLDSIYSGLAPVDREQAGYLAHLQDAQAKGVTYEGVAAQTQSAGLDLERAALERQLAVEAGAPAAQLAEFDAQIVDARRLLDGDPAVATQIQDLERQIDRLDKGAQLYDPNRPPDWRAGYERNVAELQGQIDELRLLLPENALLSRLRDAQSAYDTAGQQLATQEGELQTALLEYHEGIAAQLPAAQAGLEEFRQNVDLAQSAPALDQAVRDLQAILPTATPEELGAALDRIQALPNGDIVLHRLEGADGILAADPRLRVLSGREIGVPQGLERFAEELVVNTALLGLPSFMENQRIATAPGVSPALLGEAQFGLALDYVGFALTLAGPVIEGASAVARGGRTVIELGPEMEEALRAAGYADEAIGQIALRLNEAATSSRGLGNLLLGSSPEETGELLGMIRQTLPAEKFAMVTIPGQAGPIRQLAQRPQEVLDFLLRSDARTVDAFHALVEDGRSLDEARTIMTLAQHGRSVDEITRALGAGRSLDELVAETFFLKVGPDEAHRLSGIPRTFLSGGRIEDIAALAEEGGFDILMRDANQGLEATMAARWPKDPQAHFTFGGTDVKVASIPQQTAEGLIRFKTDGSTRVVLQIQDPATHAWVPRDLFVVHQPDGWALAPGSELANLPRDSWAMGGDIDLLAVLERRGTGYVSQADDAARAVALRNDLNAVATVPEAIQGEAPGLFMHGSNINYFNTNRDWTPALAFTSEGDMVWLAGDDAVEYWFKARGVAGEPYARYSEAVSWLASRPIPFSSAGYLSGTVAGNLPEVMAGLSTVTSGTAFATPPTTTPTAPGSTSSPTATTTAFPEPVPTAPAATPTPTPP